MKFGSLRLRLLAGAAAFVVAAIALSAVGLTLLFERHVERWVDIELATDLDQVIAAIDAGTDGKLAIVRQPVDPRFQRALSGLYWQVVVEPDGPILRSRSLWDFDIALPPQSEVNDKVTSYDLPGPDSQTLHVLQ